MIATIAEALAPIIFVVALGWFAGRRKVMPEMASAVLATFVTRFALPISLCLAAAAAEPRDILDLPYVGTLAAALLGTWLIAIVTGRFVFARSWPEAAMQGVTASFPNMAYCGPPVLIAAIGPSAVLAVVVGNLVVTIVMIPASLVLMGGKEGAGTALRKAAAQPLVFLPVLGLVLSLTGLGLPSLLHSAADEIGKAAGGVALFTLGLILSGIAPRLDRDVLVNVGLKNVAQPAVALGVGLLVGLEGDLLKQVFLLCVLPAATAAPTLALAHGVYSQEAARSVLASTIVSILGIAAGIALTGSF